MRHLEKHEWRSREETEREKERETDRELEVMPTLLSIYTATWSLSDSLFTKLVCFSGGKKSASVLNYPSKPSGIHQLDSQKRSTRETSFQKPSSIQRRQPETGEERYGNEAGRTERGRQAATHE